MPNWPPLFVVFPARFLDSNSIAPMPLYLWLPKRAAATLPEAAGYCETARAFTGRADRVSIVAEKVANNI